MQLLKHIKDVVQGKTTVEKPRSSRWPAVRKAWLALHPVCAVCGGVKKVEVHHKEPFHLFPEKELDPKNFITLCESKGNGVNCHLFFGHLGNFKQYNDLVVSDTSAWSNKLRHA